MVFRGPILPIAIAIVVGGRRETHGFAPSTISSSLSRQQDIHSRFEWGLPALVYGADGSVVEDDAFENPDDGAARDPSKLLESLKTSVPPLIWNKIACAFAPSPHDRLTPEMVRDASPEGWSTQSIDIAVAVPASVEGGAATAAANQLVRVLVTVSFPQAWALDTDASQDEELSALLGQIKVLEGLADDRLAQQRASSGPSRDDPAYYEKLVIDQRWKERLEEEPPASEQTLPEWWTAIEPPFAPLELRDEAKLLKNLLNEDEFEDELRALFARHSDIGKIDNNPPPVLRAAVSSIGSSGLFLKARVAQTTAASDDDDDKETEIIETASIPYSNPPKEVTTTGELREGVLVLVESVDPMPMPVQPQAMAVSKESEEETITPFNEQVVEMVTKLEDDTISSSDDAIGDLEKETTPIAEDEGDDATTGETDDSEPEPEVEENEEITPSEEPSESETATGTISRQQPRPPEEEAKLAAKYAAIEDLGERAFAILRDLGMV